MFRSGEIPRTSLPFERSHSARTATVIGDRELTASAAHAPRLFDRFVFIAWAVAVTYLEVGKSTFLPGVLWSLAYLVAFVTIVLERKTLLPLLRASSPLILAFVVTGLSAIWSEAPMLVAQSTFGLFGATAIGIALASRLGLKGFIETIGILIVLQASSSALLIAYDPDLGVMGGGEWQGIFAHKNELGLAMVLGIATFACLGDEWRGIRRTLRILVLLCMMLLVLGSRSATSFSVALALALIVPLAFWSRDRNSVKPAIVGGSLLAVPIVASLVTGVGANTLLGFLGRDTSLSGRSDLWQILITDIWQKPALGYGYGVYWSPNGPAAHYLLRLIHWNPGMAHNGFLEVALNTGLFGVAALLLLLAVAVTRASAMFWQGRDRTSAWPFFAIVYVILSNFSEASFERRHNIHWIVFVAAFLFASDFCRRRALSHDAEKP